MTTFFDFIQSQALKDRLPFPIDFDMLKVESDTKVKIGKYDIATISELTVLESWFFDILQEHTAAKSREFSLLVNSLAERLKQAMNLDCSRIEAAQYLAQSKEEWSEDPAYLAFAEENAQDIVQFNSLLRQTQSTHANDMLMITMFMILRCDVPWSIGKTASLGAATATKIRDLIVLEANGNPDEAPEVTEDSEENGEDAGK
jgi:predicted DNA-binding ribbon-helix-helix protein